MAQIMYQTRPPLAHHPSLLSPDGISASAGELMVAVHGGGRPPPCAHATSEVILRDGSFIPYATTTQQHASFTMTPQLRWRSWLPCVSLLACPVAPMSPLASQESTSTNHLPDIHRNKRKMLAEEEARP
uniref:Uncharacterized protein n=1 Tax=Arundo donax TaxID=35708 RepID=A0A0A9DG56_ARUDO